MYASSNCCAPRVDGNLRVRGVTARVVLHDLTVGRNMTVENNTGTVLNSVQNNTVGWSLTCTNNADPFTGGPNTATKTIGQCC